MLNHAARVNGYRPRERLAIPHIFVQSLAFTQEP